VSVNAAMYKNVSRARNVSGKIIRLPDDIPRSADGLQ
jgi:hypothetical protein